MNGLHYSSHLYRCGNLHLPSHPAGADIQLGARISLSSQRRDALFGRARGRTQESFSVCGLLRPSRMLVCLLPDSCPYPSKDLWFSPTPVLSSSTEASVPPVVHLLQSEQLVESFLAAVCLRNEADLDKVASTYGKTSNE